MSYIERLEAAEHELQVAQNEYDKKLLAAKREVEEAEKEHQGLLRELAEKREIESNRLNVPIAEFRGCVLYPDRLSHSGTDRTLLNGVDTTVGVGTTESILTIATSEVRIIIHGAVSEEAAFRDFAEKVKNASNSCAETLKEIEENIKAIDHMRDGVYEKTPRMIEAEQKLAEAEGDKSRLSEAIVALDDLRNNPTEEDLAELAQFEREKQEREAAEAAAAEAAKRERMKKLGTIGGAVLAVIAVLSVLFGTHILCFHNWSDATCTEPQICSICGRTQGESLGHDWADATCTKPKTCNRCGKTEGKAKGHEWEDATCTDPKTCSVCGATEGDPLGHDVPNWETDVEATCTQEGHRHGACIRCDEDIEENIPMIPHTEGEWEVTKEASVSSTGTAIPGERTLRCSVCGVVLRTESYTLTAEEIAAQYKASCQSYSYTDIARNPYDYIGDRAVFRGEVVQVLEDGRDVQLRVNVTNRGYGYWDDTIYVFYTLPAGAGRILEEDIVTIYGELYGNISYETVLGATVTIPAIDAQYIDY